MLASMGDLTHTTGSELTPRKHLNADALYAELRRCFSKVEDPATGYPQIKLADVLMAAFAMFALKDPSLLAFDRRRKTEEHNLKSIYGMDKIPCDTQMRTRLDVVPICCAQLSRRFSDKLSEASCWNGLSS